MIKHIVPLFFIVLLSACGSSVDSENNMDLSSTDTIFEYDENQEKLSAVEFNNELTTMQNGMLNQIDLLFQSDSSDVDINLENAIFEASLNLDKLAALSNQEGGMEFVAAMSALMEFYRDELSDNFGEVKEILKKSTFSDENDQFLKEYDLSFAKEEERLFQQVFEAQEQFANENSIKLETL
ncbi:MAG: hypothetical protein ABJG68_10420 [Crocinitomicaceae bacterium]